MADEANKDEVEKCKRVACAAMAAGDADKATRFLQKAKRMSPGDASIDALLAKAASGGGGGASPTAQSGGGDGPRFRGAAAAGASARQPGATAGGPGAARVGKDGRSYTPEQMQLAQRILRTKDYYAILEVPRDADSKVISSAYKKLALKLHPDKNKAPGAEEAFKKLAKAAEVLQDREKKQDYDRFGDEAEQPRPRRQYRHHHDPFEQDIFSAFFGGGFQHHGGREYRQEPPDAQAQRAGFLQLLPILFLIILTTASNFASPSGSLKFSMTPTSTHRNERSTASLDVPFWVSDEFGNHYPDGSRALADYERQVEVHYVRGLHHECDYQEKTMYKKVMIAKRRGNEAEIAAAKKHPRPACKKIDKIKRSHQEIFRSAMYMGIY